MNDLAKRGLNTLRLDAAVRAACPSASINGGTQATGKIQDYGTDDAGQRSAADAALAAFDWSDAALQAWLDDQKPERKTFRAAAAQAVTDNDTFLAIAGTPTNAQVLAQVKSITRQLNKLIPFVSKLD